MIKSIEEFNKIANLFGGNGKINSSKTKEFLQYIRENNRLEKLIKEFNSEQNELINFSDILEAYNFCWKLRSARRLFINEFNLTEDSIPNIEIEITREKRHKLIKRGDTFRCTKDVISQGGNFLYKKDNIYISDIDGCITNEEGTTWDSWLIPKFIFHFEACENPGLKPNELIKINEGDKFKCIKDYKIGGIEFSKDNIYGFRVTKDREQWEIKLLSGMMLSKFQEYFVKV